MRTLMHVLTCLTLLFSTSVFSAYFVNKPTVADALDGSYVISWKKQSPDLNSYRLFERRPDGSRSIVYQSGGLSKSFSGKTNGTYTYEIWPLRLDNSNRYEPEDRYTFSQSFSLKVFLPPPTPASLSVPTKSANGTIAISWAASSTATKYQLLESVNNGAWATLTSTTTSRSYSRTGRSNGSYKYLVRAYNTSGWSGYRASGSTTVLLPPTAPSSVSLTATNTNGNIAINWGASSTATQYQLQESRDDRPWANFTSYTASNSYIRTGRLNSSYKYRVRAYNASGWGAFRVSSSVTILRLPPTPILSVPAGTDINGIYSISWEASSTATKYHLQESVNSGTWTTLGSSITNRVYSRYSRPNGSYKYRVRAYNATGWSAYSATKTVSVFLTPPIPASITVPPTSANGSIDISWAASNTATKYQLEESVNNGAWSILTSTATSRSYSLTGRNNGSYRYRVHGYNVSGWGGYRLSSSTTVLLPPLTPSSISLTATNSNGDIAITWTGSTLATKFELQESMGDRPWTTLTSSTTSRSYLRAGRYNESYKYRVRAYSFTGWSTYRVSNSVTILRLPPTQNLIVPEGTDTNGIYNISWEASEWEASRTATKYELQESVNNSTWSTLSNDITSTTYSIKDRLSGSNKYRVRAYNASGWTAYSAEKTVTVLLPPAEPASITVSTASVNGSIDISWAASNTATKYELQESVDNGTWATLTSLATSRNFSRTDRSNGRYKYQVRAYNTSGWSLYRISTLIIVKLPEDWQNTGGTVNGEDVVDTTPPTPPLDAVGMMSGKGSVNGGAASYSIPIKLPTGRADFAPKVSLNYSSTSGYGIAGVGWSLSAGSSISRCGNIAALDGINKGVTYSNSDKLCFNGSRLIETNDNRGSATKVYRTEIDQHLLVKQYNALNSKSVTFEVHYKNNQVGYFGTTINSQVFHPGAVGHISWLISRLEDTSGENVIDYSYSLYGLGEHLLDDIYYTGTQQVQGNRNVHFSYQANGDYRLSYLAGGKSERTQKLYKIETLYDAQPIRSYTLHFEKSLATSRALLRGVTECAQKDSQTYCLPFTSFDWQETPVTYVVEPLSGSVNGSSEMLYPLDDMTRKQLPIISDYIPHGDGNGDGTRDWKNNYLNAEEEITGTYTKDVDNCVYNRDSHNMMCLEADFNLDGKTDDITKTVVAGGINVQIRYAGTNDWVDSNIELSAISYASSNRYQDEILSIADYNGDGYPDIVIFRADGVAPTAELYLHSKDPTMAYSSGQTIYTYGAHPHFKTVSNRLRFLGDLTGDGLPDIVVDDTTGSMRMTQSTNYPASLSRYILINNSSISGTGFSQSENLPNGTMNSTYSAVSTFHDFNGDGLADFISYNAGFEYYLNQGNGKFIEVANYGTSFDLRKVNYPGTQGDLITDFYHLKFGNQFRSIDIDGDGIMELLEPDLSRVVAEGCTSIQGQTDKCDDDIYIQGINEVFTQSSGNTSSGYNGTMGVSQYNVDRYVDGLYYFNIVRFNQLDDGSIDVSREPTELIGHVTENSVVDAYGRGLNDFVFAYGKRSVSNTIGNITSSDMRDYNGQFGIYINKATNAPNNGYQANDVIKSVSKGDNSNLYEWVYKPLTSDFYDGTNSRGLDFYQPSSEISNLPEGSFNFSSSMYVVAQYKQKNAVGSVNQTLFTYEQGAYDTLGRGMLGFKEIHEFHDVHERYNKTTYDQVFPYISSVLKQESYTNNTPSTSVLLSQSDFNWSEYSTGQASTGVYLASKSSTSFDEGGNSLGLHISDTTAIDVCGNITAKTDEKSDSFGTYQTSVLQTFDCDQQSWWLNKLTNKTTTKHAIFNRTGLSPRPGSDENKIIVNAYTNWDSNHRKYKTNTATAKNAGGAIEDTITNQFVYNLYGLPESISITSRTFNLSDVVTSQTRQTRLTYSNDGQTSAIDGYYVYSSTNELNQVTQILTNPVLGKPVQSTDVAGLVTYLDYDAFGRPYSQQVANLPVSYTNYQWAIDVNAPINSIIAVEVTQSGSPTNRQYFDLAGKVIKTSQQGFDGTYIHQLISYNARGLKTFESTPYPDTVSDSNAIGRIWSNFDALGRAQSSRQPTSTNWRDTTYSYSGLTTTISTDGLLMSRQYNSLNWLMQTSDALGGVTRYAYDGAGNPIAIEAIAGVANNVIYAKYDSLNRKIWVEDPNQGTTNFTYSGFGELVKQTDANSNIQRFIYDGLGRIKTRQETTDGSVKNAVFIWDQSRIGEIFSESFEGVNKKHFYTPLGQIANIDLTIDSNRYITENQYDNYGRLKAIVYPNQLTVGLKYNLFGYLEEEYNPNGGYIYRKITAQDHWGNITQANLTDGALASNVNYDPRTGQMSLTKVEGSATVVQSLGYSFYDSFGNLKTQHNYVTNSAESFNYDNLHRLTDSNFSSQGLSNSINYDYDALGNLTLKSDYASAYNYDGSKPNAVSSVLLKNNETLNFSYDGKGNLKSDGKRTLTYNVHDKPVIITQQGNSVALTYGADLKRYKQTRVINGETTLTHYIDKLYEVDYVNNEAYPRAYIGNIAIIGKSIERGSYIHYLHGDRLGSVATITDHNGQIVATRSSDPFGKPRHGDFSNSLVPTLTEIDGAALTRRGFTQHEHLDEMQLIHMNGRVYDYNLGRFLSVDPFIVSPGNSQAINPYSYGMNNPLSGTDPTGYVWETVWDVANVVYDVGKIGYGYSTSNPAMISEGFVDLAADAIAVATPFLPAGSTKLGRVTIEGVGVSSDAKKISKGNGASKAIKGEGADIGSEANKKTGIIYERTNPKTGECYIGQCKSPERFEMRKKEHDKKLGVKHDYEIVDSAKPGKDLDIAEHNKIQEKTKGMRAKDSSAVQNKKDPVGKARRSRFGVKEPKRSASTGKGSRNKGKVTGMVRVSGKIESNNLKKGI